MTTYTSFPAQPQLARSAPPFHHWNTSEEQLWLTFYRLGHNRYLLRFADCADFLLDFESGEVAAFPTPETDASTLDHLYLNQVLPLLQSHLGELVLHGSAIVMGGAAVAFLGQSGAGKSTLATSFALANHPFLTDDGLILTPSPAGYQVQPSHPTVRLWEDSRVSLLGDNATTVMPVQYNSKSRIVSSSAMPYCDQPLDLRALYFLGLEEQDGELLAHESGQADGDTVHIRRLAPGEAVIALINHSFVLDIEARDVMAKHFDQLTALAGAVPCYSLHYARRYDVLPHVHEALKRHSAELAQHLTP